MNHSEIIQSWFCFFVFYNITCAGTSDIIRTYLQRHYERLKPQKFGSKKFSIERLSEPKLEILSGYIFW